MISLTEYNQFYLHISPNYMFRVCAHFDQLYLRCRDLPFGTNATSTSSSKPTRSGEEMISRTSPERLRGKLQRKSWNTLVNYLTFILYSSLTFKCFAYLPNSFLCLSLQPCSGSAATSCRTSRRSWPRSREARPGSRGGSASRKHWTQR